MKGEAMTTDPVTAEELLAEAITSAYGPGDATNMALIVLDHPQLREAIEFGLLKPLVVNLMDAARAHHNPCPQCDGLADRPCLLGERLDALTTALEAREQKP